LKKIITSLAVLTAFSTSVFAAEGDLLKEEKLEALKNTFPAVLQVPGLKVTRGMERKGFSQLEVEVNTPQGPQTFEVFILDGKNDVLFAGQAYDNQGKAMSFPVDVDTIKAGVALTHGTGSEDVYLVTDPECPYCQELEKHISPTALKKYKIHLIPMPLSFHPEAIPMLYYAFDAGSNDKVVERLSKVMKGEDKGYKDFKPSSELKAKVDKIIESGYKAAHALKAQGTPSLYDKDFRPTDARILAQ
jgi:thiol:disulfide interchange protein